MGIIKIELDLNEFTIFQLQQLAEEMDTTIDEVVQCFFTCHYLNMQYDKHMKKQENMGNE